MNIEAFYPLVLAKQTDARATAADKNALLLTGPSGVGILLRGSIALEVPMSFRTICVALFLPFFASCLLWPAVSLAQIVGAGRHNSSSIPSDTEAPAPEIQAGQTTCSPAPCVLPNVLISEDEADSTVIAAGPEHPNDLLAASYAFPSCAGAGIFTSSNDGSAWQNPACVNGLGEEGDPSVAYGIKAEYVVGTSGDSSGSATYSMSSTNNGATWRPQVEAVAPIFDGGNGDTNVPWVQVDNSSSSLFENAVYVSVTQFDIEVVESEISVAHSTDGGNTWTATTVDPVQYKPEVDQFSRMAVGLDGTLYVAWQRCAMTGPTVNCADTEANMLISKSTDGGNTWSAPAQIAAVRLVPETCSCGAFFGNLPNSNEPVANIPVLAIDNSKGAHAGNLYAVMYNWTGKQMRVQVVTSTDGGDTWGTPVFVAPAAETHDQFFPSITVSPNGAVGVSWLDRRNDPLNVSYQPFAATSSNGGKSFGTNYALATNLSDPYLDGAGGNNMGDYIGNAWAGAHQFLVTWPDTRNMEFMQDYFGGLMIP